ncbi:hypothetical protein DIPPA_15248 [Diplonema papillatum]|nr:hypothetical protein DIPPA_15248 [Diplonema papillatum]
MAVGGLLYWHQQAYCEPDLVKRRRELLEKDPALRKRVELDEARRKLIMEHYGLDNRMGGKPM